MNLPAIPLLKRLLNDVDGALGGLTGALIGMGIPAYVARCYEGRAKAGGILLSVHSDDSDWTKRAKEILQQTGAQDISSTAEAAADYAKSDRPLARAATGEEALRIPGGMKRAVLDQQADGHPVKIDEF